MKILICKNMRILIAFDTFILYINKFVGYAKVATWAESTFYLLS